jgi:hypothetical protein
VPAIGAGCTLAHVPNAHRLLDKRRRSELAGHLRKLLGRVEPHRAAMRRSQLPDSLPDLVTGLAANESVDGSAHENIVTSVKAPDGNFLDPWGNAYTYNQAERTLTCTPNDASGAAMTPVVKQF